jgi:GntR family transcriptional repressor for pyruvate dehydrogenase complex
MEELRKDTLARRVCEQLVRFIEENELEPGDRLPSQQRLSKLMKISGVTLREGLKYAEALGIIYTKHGSGSFVNKTSVDDLLFFSQKGEPRPPVTLSDKEWHDLLEMRLILETAAVRLAGCRIGDYLPSLREQVELMEANENKPEAFAEADIGFHQVIVRAVDNQILENMYTNMLDLIRRLQLTILQEPNEFRRSIAGHWLIYERLSDGDVAGAQEAMDKHLRWALEIGCLHREGQ